MKPNPKKPRIISAQVGRLGMAVEIVMSRTAMAPWLKTIFEISAVFFLKTDKTGCLQIRRCKDLFVWQVVLAAQALAVPNP